jgi:hypothetical protein
MAFSRPTSLSASSLLFSLLISNAVVLADEAPLPLSGTAKSNAPIEPDFASPSRLLADTVRYEGGTVVLLGSATRPAKFLSGVGEITAQTVRVDTLKRTVSAKGGVRLTRTREDKRKVLRTSRLPTRYERATITETLRGENLEYDFNTKKGSLDQGTVELADFSLNVASLTINGEKYIAQRVVLRPGGQTPEEDKIYGVPPLNLRAKKIELTIPEKGGQPQIAARGAALYFKNTRLLPVPRYLLNYSTRINTPRDPQAFSLTPGISFNSTDRVLITTRLRYPLNQRINGLAFVADLGLSAKETFRGGAGFELNNGLGQFALQGKVKDIVTTQLIGNKLMLDRLPELSYRTPDVRLFKLPGGRQTGFRLEGAWGDYREQLVNRNLPNAPRVKSSRRMAGIHFTTRMPDREGITPSGPYVDLFASRARYSLLDSKYNTSGFEIGYDGKISNKLRGVFSYRRTRIDGATPFLFDLIEIPRELRTTFDYQISPRYLIPIDLRYDLDRDDLRDASFGVLRSYKSFAYGVTYNTARNDLKLEFRAGF